jgi:hypothetical protein
VYQDAIEPATSTGPLPAFIASFLQHIYGSVEVTPHHRATFSTSPQDALISPCALAMHDPLCMGVFIDYAIIRESMNVHVDVETCQVARTKGMCIVDKRRWQFKQPDRKVEDKSLVQVVLRVDNDAFFCRFMKVRFVLWRCLDAEYEYRRCLVLTGTRRSTR